MHLGNSILDHTSLGTGWVVEAIYNFRVILKQFCWRWASMMTYWILNTLIYWIISVITPLFYKQKKQICIVYFNEWMNDNKNDFYANKKERKHVFIWKNEWTIDNKVAPQRRSFFRSKHDFAFRLTTVTLSMLVIAFELTANILKTHQVDNFLTFATLFLTQIVDLLSLGD